MSLGQLVLELKLNGNEFTVNLKQAQGQLAQFITGTQRANTVIRQAESRTRGWGSAIRDSVISLALARDAIRTLSDVTFGWQKAIIATNSEMEKSIMLMKNFSKQKDPVVATQEAVADVQKLLGRASTSPFNLTQVTDAFVKLRVGGVDPVFKSLDTLIDSVSAFGGTGEQLKRAGVAIQQMSGKGVVSMEELRQQLGEAVPTAINAMADGLSTSYSKLVKEISQGKVLSKPAILAMMQELERSFAGSAANMMNTWGGAMAQFETGMKKLAVSFGGLTENGYEEGGYLKTVTNELKGLNAVLSDPGVLNDAKAVGKAVAEMITTIANGTKWIIENRNEIVEWGKALVILWASFKGASIIGGVLTTMGASMGALSLRMIQLRMAGAGLGSTLLTTMGAMSGWNSRAAIAAGGAVRIATGSNAAGAAVRVLGGALAVMAGPIGIVTALAAAGAYAWYDYKKGVNEAEKAILGMHGALTSMADLQTLSNVRDRLQQEHEEEFVNDNKATRGYRYGTENDMAAFKAAKQKSEDEIAKVNADMIKARGNVAENYARIEAQREIQANSAALGEISRKYVIDKEAIRTKMEAEAKKSGKKLNEDNLAAAFIVEQKKRVQSEIDLYEKALSDAEKKQKELQPNKGKSGAAADGDDISKLVQIKAGQTAMDEYRNKISEAKDAMLELGKVKLKDTIVDGMGGNGKPKFDAMSIFVDGLRKKLATLDAKIDETNPYLAQLEATIESLDGKKLPNFDAVYAEGKKLAESMWEQEKARKAITDANKLYTESLERIDQIDSLVRAKLNKVEEKNPWEKASADSIRYYEELDELIEKMEEARRKAQEAQNNGNGQSLLQKLQEDAVVASAKVEETRQTIARLQAVDATKKMSEDSRDMADSLLTSTEMVKVQYQRQTAWADQFYEKHKEQLNEDAVALADYYEYRKQLDLKFQADSENGLDAWIRQNRDAAEQYKTLWGSAMDRFNDTLATGLATGKFAMKDFVVFVLEELLKIQIAKAMAAAAGAASSAASPWLSAGLSAIGGFFGGTGGNGLAAGSAGATSSSLGASAAGYSAAYGFANGGIMTEFGAASLKKYANGGIADRPQIALYGEGDMAEAYVPLPDGRTIPVTMTGGAGSTSSTMMPVSINITVNNDGTESTQTNSDEPTLTEMAGRIKALVKEVLLVETRPGGIISKRTGN